MNEYKVSIIVGIYNSSEFLEKGLNSLMNQTWSNIEVLMMDDGSTDKSGEICDAFSQKDKRFISVHKKNSGVCDSRNMGLQMATGEYVCFMDGDDWLSDDFVEYMMSIIQKTHTKMAFSDKLFTTKDQNQIDNDKIEIWNSEKTISYIIYPCMELGPWNKIYSLKLIREKNIRFPSHWFGETLHFASTVAYYSEKVGVGHKKVYNYRLNNINSGTTQFNVKTRLLSLDNCLNLRKTIFYSNKHNRNAVEWHIYANYFSLIVHILGSNAIDEYNTEYHYAKNYLRHNCFRVFINSKLSIKERVKIIIEALCPKLFAKRAVKQHLNRLQQINN